MSFQPQMCSRMELTHISLFSGIGGIDLAAEWAGFETILFVEKDKYCQKVLNKHWPNMPRMGDIKSVTREKIEELTGSGTATIVSGGYPCQGESVAGKRGGKADDRWLWPEMFRIIQETKPSWVLGENVAGHITLGLDAVLSDLEGIGYSAQTFVIPACAIGTWHIRDRVFVVANSSSNRYNNSQFREPECCTETRQETQETIIQGNRGSNETLGNSKILPNTICQGCSNIEGCWEKTIVARLGLPCSRTWWRTEPELGRVVHGVSSKLDESLRKQRVRALGNTVVPQQIYPILKAIADIETTIHISPK